MATRPFAKTEQAITTLTPADLARLDAYAESVPTSRADAIRGFILDGLDREDMRRDAGLKP